MSECQLAYQFHFESVNLYETNCLFLVFVQQLLKKPDILHTQGVELLSKGRFWKTMTGLGKAWNTSQRWSYHDCHRDLWNVEEHKERTEASNQTQTGKRKDSAACWKQTFLALRKRCRCAPAGLEKLKEGSCQTNSSHRVIKNTAFRTLFSPSLFCSFQVASIHNNSTSTVL